jgi:single-strand DNA-binding protein
MADKKPAGKPVKFYGNLGRDPECRYTSSGKLLVKFSVAEKVKVEGSDEKKTVWHNCIAWEGIGDRILLNAVKGTRVRIGGAETSREYEKEGEKKVWVEVKVEDITFLDREGKPIAREDEVTSPAQEDAVLDGEPE